MRHPKIDRIEVSVSVCLIAVSICVAKNFLKGMMMRFFAHSGKDSAKSDWQTLVEHSENVARLASQMASVFGCEKAAHAAGLFHDLGKYNPAFQRRLEGSNTRVDHSTAGAVLLPLFAKGQNRDIAKLIAYIIAGHHAGLPDMTSESGSLSERVKNFKDELDGGWKNELTFDLENLAPSFDFSKNDKKRAAFQFSLLTRMIFSCLVDADYKDTEAFYDKLENRTRDREWQPLQKLLPQFTNAFDAKMDAMSKADTKVNLLRTDILNHVRAQSTQKPGLFTLTVPTGGGKTLASLGFALDHAKLHGHDRIIYAIPFTSIIDQTAKIFSDLLGADHILEHHSAIDSEASDKGKRRDWRDKLKLAMEDWAAPIVVTTNVQFFESLFASRTSASRKLHNIANSVIILDEAQTIPRNLLSPCMRVLDELAKNYKCSIVLCTATQPATDARNFTNPNHPAGLPLEGRELAPDPQHLANSLRRVTIQKPRVMSNDDLLSELQQTSQGLIIVNSRKHASALYQMAQKSGMDGLVHLTTRQCSVDRRKILAEVRTRLESKQFCRVIATSLVEAGVDVDFPRVWRAEAGLDQIAQAAGRCNREGKRPVKESIVSVFTAPDYPPPAEIKALTGDMSRILHKHEADLLSPAAIADYFGEVYWRLGEKGLDAKDILSRFKMDRTGTDFSYRSVAEDFRMIESGMVPVIIPMDEKSKAWVDKLGVPEIGSGKLARELQTYTVQVPPKARQLLLANGRVEFVAQKLREDQFAVLTDPKIYTPELGLLWEDADYLSTEALVN
jgi:CRISPR-associated endonuclease/helicase Cas3